MNNILILTTSRSDYGLLNNIIDKIEKSKKLNLSLVVSGTHLLKSYSDFYNQYIKNKYANITKIKIPISLNKNHNFNAWSIFLNKFSKIIENQKPCIAILLGDRLETLLAAISLHSFNIPIAHIGGGEITKGATDNAFRHSITKLSNLHFVSHKEYFKRIMQLGENKNSIFYVGDPAVELINNLKFKSKDELEKEFKFKLFEKNIIVTYHPETLDLQNSKKNFYILLKFLEKLKNYRIIFTFPNADQDSNNIIKMIIASVKKNKNFIIFKEMGTLNYLSTMKFCKFIIGNSSSGLTEAPLLKIPSINYGNRQEGRIKYKTVIDCKTNLISLEKAIKKVNQINNKTVYYKGKTFSSDVVKIIKKQYKNISLKKEFNDQFSLR
ncbi:UDP-N-acetylglucosamine 2-epimerase [Pelagibacteraceae bacterium]|nr:UDP-N-acetylglucosamine 2-epimerase [Pelagibacteraceae bacterium]